jgi:hypothetical protein
MKSLQRKTLKELKQMCKDRGMYFHGLGYRPKSDYIDALTGKENRSITKEVYEQWKNELGANSAMKEEDEYDVKPFSPGSYLSIISKGKNVGKYEVRGMHGARNSLKRFVGIPFYIVAKGDTNEGLVYTTREEAEWHKDKFGGVVKEITLTKEEIVK